MKNILIKNCNECPFLFLNEYRGVLKCMHPDSNNISFSSPGVNERDVTINYIHKDCPMKKEPVCLFVPLP